MTGQTHLPAAIAAAWDDLCEQIEADDGPGAVAAARWLAAVLTGEDPGLALDACLTLAQWWADLDPAASDDEHADAQTVRALLVGVLEALAVLASTRDPATAMILEIRLAEDGPRAAELALDVLEDPDHQPSDELGALVIRSLVAEASRLEDARQRPTSRFRAGLVRTLDHPTWLPDGLSRGELTSLVAWVHFLSDDYGRLPDLVDTARTAPDHTDFSRAVLALLDVAAAQTSFDPTEVELKLRLAGEAVTRSGDPQLITAHRGVSDLMARTRLQRLSNPIDEMGTLAPDRVRDGSLADLSLLLDVIEQIGRRQIDEATRTRLHAWQHSGRADHMDAVDAAVLWALSGAVAVADGDLAAARSHVAEARRLRGQVVDPTPQVQLLDHVLVGFTAIAELREDPSGSLELLRASRDDAQAAGQGFLAAVAGSQVALAALAQGRSVEALESSVNAYQHLRASLTRLTGSSERTAALATLSDLRTTMLRAAAADSDPHVLAEVLEFLRAQGAPAASIDPDAAQLPLAHLLPREPGRSHFFEQVPDLTDAVAMVAPGAVLMPWGTVALARLLDEGGATPAPLVVPR